MRRVSFIMAEHGDKDLIISFALQDEDDPTEIQSLTLLRTPVYEAFLYPQELGVVVSFEGEPESDEANCMTAFRLRDEIVEIKTRHGQSYELDLGRVDQEEIEAAKRLLQKMNFDGAFELVVT